MTIDNEGMLWVALCHGGMVIRVDPRNGELLRKVELPCVETTACAFGGPNLDRLFVTTGCIRLWSRKMRVKCGL